MSPLLDARTQLETVGIKPTHQRLVILATLTASRCHLSAEMVHEQLHADFPSLSLGTVYRTLDLFADNGLVRRVSTDKGSKRYDANLDDHHHLICQDSQEIIDYDDPELTQLLEAYFKRKQVPGFEINYIQLNVMGRKTDPPTTSHS